MYITESQWQLTGYTLLVQHIPWIWYMSEVVLRPQVWLSTISNSMILWFHLTLSSEIVVMWLHYSQSNYTIFSSEFTSYMLQWTVQAQATSIPLIPHNTQFLQTLQSLKISQNSVPYSLSRLLLVTRCDKIFSRLNLFHHNSNNYLLTYVVHFKAVSLVFYAVSPVIITKFGEQEAYGMTVILFLARNTCTGKTDWAGVCGQGGATNPHIPLSGRFLLKCPTGNSRNVNNFYCVLGQVPSLDAHFSILLVRHAKHVVYSTEVLPPFNKGILLEISGSFFPQF